MTITKSNHSISKLSWFSSVRQGNQHFQFQSCRRINIHRLDLFFLLNVITDIVHLRNFL